MLSAAFSAASLIAFCSTDVIFVGQQISMRGFEKSPFTFSLLMKCFSMASVTSKSAITPSFSGRIATIFPGVRPTIRLASSPTASTLPLFYQVPQRKAHSEQFLFLLHGSVHLQYRGQFQYPLQTSIYILLDICFTVKYPHCALIIYIIIIYQKAAERYKFLTKFCGYSRNRPGGEKYGRRQALRLLNGLPFKNFILLVL